MQKLIGISGEQRIDPRLRHSLTFWAHFFRIECIQIISIQYVKDKYKIPSKTLPNPI